MGSIVLNVYCNTDDAFLVWKANKIEGCLGFAIEREWLATAVPGRDLNQSEYLLNRVGFEGDVEAGPHQQWTSDIAPFQRYNWIDHELTFGDRARYRIVPMVGKVGDGIETSSGLVAAMEDVSNAELRDFCGGTLIVALRELFDRADAASDIALYAALFELMGAEIIDRFCRLGERAHIVLANGSPKVSEPDPNADGRAALRQAGCEVIDRMCATAGERGDLGHNKFIVVTRKEQAEGVWTGSTNLTPTGLFTQINNAIYIDQTALAEQYRTQWKRLADAQSEVPSTLKKSNAAPAEGIAAPVSVQPWFTPTVKQNDIARLKELVRNAKDGILFLAFMPRPTGPLIDILESVTTLSGREPWQKLEDKPSWQDSRQASARQQAEWEFWL